MNSLPGATRLGTSAPATTPAIELVTSDDGLTFEAAHRRALWLQTEFAAAKKADGAKTALARYLNPQVSHWANAFDNRLTGMVAYTVGTGADGASHVAQKPWATWVDKFGTDHSCRCQGGRLPHEDGDCAGRVTIAASTFRQHFALLPGVTERTMHMRPTIGKRGGQRQWNDAPTKITLNTGAVVREEVILTGKRGRPDVRRWTEPWDITSTSDYYTEKLEGNTPEGLIGRPTAGQRQANGTNLLPSVPSSVRSASSQAHEGAPLENEPGREEGAASVDPGNTFIVWQAKSGQRKGQWLDFSLANRPRRTPKDATTITLTPEEATYLRQSWPMEKGLSPAERTARVESRAQFLLATADARAAWISEAEAENEAEMEREAAAEQQRMAEAAAEQARADDEIESWRARFEAIGKTFSFDMHLKTWRKDGLTGERVLARIPRLLEKLTAKYEEEQAAKACWAAPSPSPPATIVANADQEEDSQAAQKAAKQTGGANVYRDILRAQLASLEVDVEEIERRITNEWAGLKSYVIDHNLKVWAQAVQSANAVHEN